MAVLTIIKKRVDEKMSNKASFATQPAAARIEPLEVNVHGNSDLTAKAELVVLDFVVSAEAASQNDVSTAIRPVSRELQSKLETLSTRKEQDVADAPVTIYTMGSLSTRSCMPRNRAGETQQKIFSASIAFTATFQDFDVFNEVADKLLNTQHVQIRNLEWRLREGTRHAMSKQSRQLALQDAMEKAEQFASALGRELVVSKVDDESFAPSSRMLMRSEGRLRGMGEDEDDAALSLIPEDVQVSCSVAVSFVGKS